MVLAGQATLMIMMSVIYCFSLVRQSHSIVVSLRVSFASVNLHGEYTGLTNDCLSPLTRAWDDLLRCGAALRPQGRWEKPAWQAA